MKSSDPKCLMSRNSAIRKPKSPTRLTMKAFLPADAAESRGHEESQSKRCAGKGQRGRGDGLPCEPLPEETVQRRTNQRQDWDQPEVEVRHHSLSRFT